MLINNADFLKVIKVAIDAGKATKEIYQTDFSVETKDDMSPLTKADMQSHNIIQKGLEYTDLPLMSEEGNSIDYNDRKNWNYYWLIDPLDGTKEFVKKNGEFTINIALINKSKPVTGIIYIPVLDILYWASIEHGSYKTINAEIMLQKCASLENLIVLSHALPMQKKREIYTIVASRSHLSKETEDFINEKKKIHKEINTISKGSSIKLCMVAEGQADIYPRFAPTSEWDTAAGQAIVECSGGKVLQINEKDPVIYNKKDILNPWFIVSR